MFFNEARNICSLFENQDGNILRFAWVHRVYLKQSSSDKDVDRFISKTTLKSFEHNDFSSHFGWGDSLINLERFKHHDDLYDGCIFSQYFYFALHQFNKFVPDVIEQLNTNYRLGKLTKIRKEGVHLKQRIFELEIQYADYLHSVAGEMRDPASQFDKNWRIPELRTNLMSKIPVLQDLLQDVENRSSRRSDIFIESVLFFVSILSLVGLFLGAHDYLTKPADQHKASFEVLVGMLPTNPNDILSLAIGLSVMAFSIFLLLKLLSKNR